MAMKTLKAPLLYLTAETKLCDRNEFRATSMTAI